MFHGSVRGQEQDTIAILFERLVSIPSDSNMYYFGNPPVTKPLLKVVHNVLKRNPSHRYAPFFARIELFMIEWIGTNITPDSIQLLEAQLVEYHKSFKLRDFHYFYYMSGAYGTLHLMAKASGSIRLAIEYLNKGEPFVYNAVNVAKEMDQQKYLDSIWRLYGFYNNKALLLWASTHHYDPLWKRNDAGPILERDMLKADSCYNLIKEIGGVDYFCSYYDYAHLRNLKTLYGSYYRNDLKAQYYHDQTIRDIQQCSDLGYTNAYRFKTALLHNQLSWGWVLFSNRDYRDCVNLIRVQLDSIAKYNANVIPYELYPNTMPDLYYAMSQSYHNLHQYDSAIYFGELQLADTINYKDYLYLAETAATLAEIYIMTDVDRAIAYLSLSKKMKSNVEHEIVFSELMNEGKRIALDQVNLRIQDLTDRLEEREQHNNNYKLYFWVVLFLFGAFLVILTTIQYVRISARGNRYDHRITEIK